MHDSVLAQLAALPQKSTAELKQMWRELYDREPPPFNKPFLVKRLAYRIQELAYGGLSARAEAKLKALIEEEDARVKGKQPVRKGDRPIAGTRLIREWQGVEHTRHGARRRLRVPGPASTSPVGHRPRHHRHALERAALLRPAEPSLASESARPQNPLRRLHPRLHRRAARHGVQLARRPARGRRWPTSPARSTRAGSLVGDRYDDGGFSGGTMERPALQRLLRDVEHGAIDVIVVYKVDRLSRSLTDFARIVEVFERHSVSFVSVTQAFNTTTSMGRLTLNILLSFAQFEREVIGERIRDKFAASPAQGHVDGRHTAARLRRRATASWW